MDEVMISGYCRAMDQSRMVTAELDGGQWYVDCGFGQCPYESSCTIAARIRELQE